MNRFHRPRRLFPSRWSAESPTLSIDEPALARAAVESEPLALEHVGEEMRGDHALCLAAVRRNPGPHRPAPRP